MNEKENEIKTMEAHARHMASREEPCGRCGNGGAVECKDIFCDKTRWSFQKIKPIEMERAREVEGGWEYAARHIHRCDCSVSRAYWEVYDRKKQLGLIKS